jgi:hypothetical protein
MHGCHPGPRQCSLAWVFEDLNFVNHCKSDGEKNSKVMCENGVKVKCYFVEKGYLSSGKGRVAASDRGQWNFDFITNAFLKTTVRNNVSVLDYIVHYLLHVSAPIGGHLQVKNVHKIYIWVTTVYVNGSVESPV